MLPLRFSVVCLADDVPFDGAYLGIVVPMRDKNDYGLVFGPTDEHGHLSITRDEIIEEADRDRRMFLMDYLEITTGVCGPVKVHAMSLEEVDRALSAYELFRDVAEYPPNYQRGLTRCREALMAMKPDRLTVKILDGEGVIACYVQDR